MPTTTIQVIPDRFDAEQASSVDGLSKNPNQFSNSVRRPTRGIVIKEDTYATLRVVALGNNKSIDLIDAGSNRPRPDVNNKRVTDVYSNFLIQAVSEERAEKQQIIETFGEPFIFLFGERARIVSFQGVLINTFDFNWEAEWWENYDKFLRGTQCVENDARVYIAFDETLVSGYILQSSAQKVAQERSYVQFNFSLFVTGYTNFSKLGDPNALEGAGPISPSSAAAAKFRPTLIAPNQTITGVTSLQEGLAVQGVQAVQNAWNSAQAAASNLVSQVGTAITGTGTLVRVPIGFEGALAFDEEVLFPEPIPGSIDTVIRYSTFDKNTDEYVGGSSHYGSSFNQRPQFGQSVEEEALSETEMSSQIQQIWLDAGFSVNLSEVSKAVHDVRLGIATGMVVANTAKAISSTSGGPTSANTAINGARAGGSVLLEG
jgi:uncharacterized protein YukE